MRQTLLCVLVCAGCEDAGDDTSPTNDVLAIAGSYTDQWGVDHTIDEVSWVQVAPYGSSSYAVLSFDNAIRSVIAQNASTNAYDADLFSRFDWVEGMHGDLFFCQTAWAAASEDAAEATPRSDDTDPETTGCGGFPWTNLVP
jgi:hypothetical protein